MDSLSVEDLENLPPTASMEVDPTRDSVSEMDAGRRDVDDAAAPPTAPNSGLDADPRSGSEEGTASAETDAVAPLAGSGAA